MYTGNNKNNNMADPSTLLIATSTTTTLGNAISLSIITFLDTITDQPAGFKPLALDFLSICEILNSLEESLNEHFKSKQPFPRQAIPELTKILEKTKEDFESLKGLLGKFMDYEKGGAVGRVMKTWRIVFADKEIGKVRGSLQANKGALTMTMLLTNLNPHAANSASGSEYGKLAAKLQQGPLPETSPVAELPGYIQAPQELPAGVVVDTSIYGTPNPNSVSMMSETPTTDNVTPSVSEMSISDRAPEPSIVSSMDHEIPQVVGDGLIPVEQVTSKVPTPPLRIHMDRSKIQFRTAKQTLGAGNVSLQKALVSAVVGQKLKVVEQLLDRGVSPDTGLEKSALTEATKGKEIKILRLLLEFGADPNFKIASGTTPLRIACELNREAEAELLLKYGADPNVLAPDRVPLAHAVFHKNQRLVQLLLQYGADPVLKMKTNENALVYAADRDCPPEIMELMLCYGADPNVKDARGFSALLLACRRNQPRIVECLLTYGADPNMVGPELPLVEATRYPQCLKALLCDKVDLSKRKGILELATYYNSIESVKMLLDFGADPNEKSQNIYSPLTTAIRDNRPEIMKLLLSTGADPYLKGQNVPIFMATLRPELLKILLDGGFDLKRSPGALEMAVFHNKLDSVRILLDAGVDPNEKKDGIYTPLTTAIRDNRPEILALLLSRGANPNLKGQGIPLHMAVARVEILKQLLEGGADLAKCPGALEFAVVHNKIESVIFLLDAGVNPNEKKDGIYTPLTTAIRDNRPEILELLLARGADPNLKGQDVPLVLAVRHPAILKQLIASGADVTKYQGLIELAVCHNKIESINILLEAGVPVDEKHRNVYSPLTTAIRDNRPDILELLLAKGADPNMKGQEVPLVLALRNPPILKKLIASGADVRKYQGLLELAVCYNKVESIDILLEAGVPIDEKHQKIHTPITTAIRDNRIEILKHLLSKGADPNLAGDGLPLVNAARFEDQQRLRVLLDAGADVNKQINGRSALMEACDRNMVNNVKLLLERGADADIVDEKGNSAMDMAANKGYDEIVMLLLDAMG